MKKGMTLVQLAETLEEQAEQKRDFIADTRNIRVGQGASLLSLSGFDQMQTTHHARRQLAEKLNIPVAYFDRLSEHHPELLDTNVNSLLAREKPSKLMVRTLDDTARAFLSDRYRPLDNFDLASAVLPELQAAGAVIESCNVTPTKMYIKALAPWLDREVPMPEGYKMGVGHNIWVRKVVGAISITNSEVGSGGLNIDPGVFEKQCTNLATFKADGYGRVHLGKRATGDDSVFEFLSDETRKLDDAAVWAKARDMVKATLDGRVIDRIVQRLVDARGDEITGDPVKVVEVFAKKNSLTQNERGGLLKMVVESGEMNRYGLQWGVTRLAGEVEDYDRASELERLGGRVIEMPQTDWAELAQAA